MKKLGLTLYCILIVGVFYGQERVSDEKQSAIDQIIELVSENLETEELDFTTFLEDLNLYYTVHSTLIELQEMNLSVFCS